MRTTGLVILGAALQQAAATGWIDAKSFSCPSNTNNDCNQDQKKGFDWSGSTEGKDFQTYGGFDFSGFTYVNSFHAKRDFVTPRTFQDNCIKGSVTKDAPTAPKISCGSGKSFSINDLQVSTSKDTDLEFIYGYDNGDVCKHTAPCSKSGSTVTNSQCGGATSITFQIPKNSNHSDCDVGIHRVSFDCGPPSIPSSPPSTPSVTFSQSSAPNSRPSGPLSIPSFSKPFSIPTGNLSSVGTGTAPAAGTPPVTILTSLESSASASGPFVSTFASSSLISVSTPYTPVVSPPTSTPVVSPPGVSPPVASPPVVSPPAVSPPVASPPVVSPPAASPPIPSPPAVSPPVVSFPAPTPLASSSVISSPPATPISPSLPGVTQPIVTTEIVYTTLSTCPVENTVTSAGSQVVQSSFTISTILSTVTSTVCTKCIAPKPSTPATPSLPISAPVPSESSATPVAQSSGSPPIQSIPNVSIPVTGATTLISQVSVPAPPPSLPGTTQEVVTTEIVYTTVSTCPVTNTVTSGNSQITQVTATVSTIFSTITSTICTRCIAPPKTQAASSAPPLVPSTPPSGPAPVPSPPSGPAPVPSSSSGPAPVPSSPSSPAPVPSSPSGPAPVPSPPSGPAPAPSSPSSPAPVPSPPSGPAPAPSSPSSPAPVPSPPSGPAPAPSVLPKCMNTWITLTKCENNADSDCYCTDSDFTKNVQDCVSSWSEDSDVIQSALSYLAGICAPHVEANPGIVTNVPSTITLVPVPVATPAASAPTGSAVTAGVITPPPAPASVPATTISLVKTITSPVTYSSGPSAGQPIPSSSIVSVLSLQVTVPQVKFTTETVPAGATGSPNVGLAAGSPAPVPAVPTSVAGPVPSPSTLATGILPTGRTPATQSGLTPFPGGAEKIRSGITGAALVGALGLFLCL